jgi:hypothetical protein
LLQYLPRINKAGLAARRAFRRLSQITDSLVLANLRGLAVTTPAKNNAIKIRQQRADDQHRDWHRPSVAALSVARRRRTWRDASASILTALAGIAVDKSVHGVAFVSWNQHPEPTSSR